MEDLYIAWEGGSDQEMLMSDGANNHLVGWNFSFSIHTETDTF